MSSPYKRRRPSLVRNFWVYRRVILLASVLGLMLWFVWANNSTVTVAFPFRLGTFSSSVGLLILLSALVGSLVTALTMTLWYAWRVRHHAPEPLEPMVREEVKDDLPPADYAAKTTDGFTSTRWP